MTLKNSLFVFLFLLNFSCSVQDIHEEIGSFDISPNDDRILFSLKKGKDASIFSMDIEDGNKKIIIQSDDIFSYVRPSYSSNGSQILFVKYEKKNITRCVLCVSNADGTNIETIIEGDEIITEAFFSKNGRDIIFCRAKAFNKNSPIGIRNAHDLDIFSINIKSKTIQQISHFDAYRISDISEIDSAALLFYLSASDKKGIFSIDKKAPSVLKKITTENKVRESDMYSSPDYSAKYNNLVFITPYELYLMDLKSGIAELIYDGKGETLIDAAKPLKNKRQLLFIKNIKKDIFFSLDLNNNNVKPINIE